MREPVSRRANGLGLPSAPVSTGPGSKPEAAHLLRLLEASLLSFFQTHVVGNKGTCRFYYIAAAAGPRRRPARTGRGDRRRRGLRHRPGERRQVGRLSAPHALLGAPTQSPAAAPPLANLISSRYLVMSPLTIGSVSHVSFNDRVRADARGDWRLARSRGPGPPLREQICLLCAVRSRRGSQRTGDLDAVELSTRCSLARFGRLRAALRSAICQSKWAAQDLQPSCCCSRAPARRSA